LEGFTLRDISPYAKFSHTWAGDDTIRSMMVLVEEWQIIRPGNVLPASEESKTEARGVWCDGSKPTIACDYVIIKKLDRALCRFVQCWGRRIYQRSGKMDQGVGKVGKENAELEPQY
jgi:hypothetical protein